MVYELGEKKRGPFIVRTLEEIMNGILKPPENADLLGYRNTNKWESLDKVLQAPGAGRLT